MNLRLKKIRDNLVIEITGELDLHTVDKLKKDVAKNLDSEIEKVILDLDDVSFIDSSGLGVILSLYKKIKNRDGEIIVMNLNSQIRRVFRLSGMLKLFRIVESKEKILNGFQEDDSYEKQG